MIPTFVSWDGRFHGEATQHAAPHFRPGTNDRDVWQAAFVENEYGIPFFNEDDTVVDIGMHIGSFSCLAYMKGSRRVHGYEVDREAYKLAVQNADAFSLNEITPNNFAVVRSDLLAAPVKYQVGSMQTGWGESTAHAVTFDDVVNDVGGHIRFLKVDCEGSEFPILYTSKQLGNVDEIAGEFHNGDHGFSEFDCRISALAQYLSDTWGFYVTFEDKELGLFRAQKTPFGEYLERP